MIARVLFFAAALLCGTVFAAASSGSAFVYVKPEKYSFWTTATNSSFSVPVPFPRGSKSATLTVSGDGYTSAIEDITPETLDGSGMIRVDLPAANDLLSENVYVLRLKFDDGTSHEAKLGVICGVEAGASGDTRCIAPKNSRRWNMKGARAVVPVPYDAGDILIDGERCDAGLGGAQGWYLLKLPLPGVSMSLSIAAGGGEVFDAQIVGKGFGSAIIVR